jgi:hypothetical protein
MLRGECVRGELAGHVRIFPGARGVVYKHPSLGQTGGCVPASQLPQHTGVSQGPPTFEIVNAGLHWSFRMSRQMPPFALMSARATTHTHPHTNGLLVHAPLNLRP